MVCFETCALRAIMAMGADSPRSERISAAASRMASFLARSICPAALGISVNSCGGGGRSRFSWGTSEEGEATGEDAADGEHGEGVAEREHGGVPIDQTAQRLVGGGLRIG